MDGDHTHEIKRCLLLGRKAMPNLDSVLKSRDITLLTKVCLVRAMVLPLVKALVLPVVMYGKVGSCKWKLDHKEGWAPKNWCFLLVVLDKTSQNPLDCKDIKLVNLQGNQPCIFTVRTDAEAEAPILWPPDVKKWFLGKDTDSGKDWRQKEKGVAQDEMVR